MDHAHQDQKQQNNRQHHEHQENHHNHQHRMMMKDFQRRFWIYQWQQCPEGKG